MKYKLLSVILVMLTVACLPGSATPGLGSSPTTIPIASPHPEESPTLASIVEKSPTVQESSPTVLEEDPTETSTVQSATATTTSYLPLIKTEISTVPPGEALIADHRVVDLFDRIPDSAIARASASRVLQKRASTGGYISGQGLNCIQGTSDHPDCTGYPDYKYDRRNWVWELWDPTEYTPWDKVTQFISVVRARQNDYDVLAMKLCFIDVWPDGFPIYRDAMLQLEREFPRKKFLWWTEPLRPEWPSQNSCETIQEFNRQVREYALANHKPLLDIADIESHDPNGRACSTGCESTCMEYAGDPNNPRNGHPSRTVSIRIAKAYWWLMARITGWDGNTD